MPQYITQVLIGIDQLANTLLAGHADETLSARAYRADVNGRILGRVLRPIIDSLFFVLTVGRQRRHCFDAWVAERERRQFPVAYTLDR